MPEPVTAVRNVGPAMAESLARGGVGSADDLRAIGPDEAYARTIEAGDRPHFMAYLALVMGLQGRPFNDAAPTEKTALRVRFDAIKARVSPAAPPGIEAALDAIGVRQPTISVPEKK